MRMGRDKATLVVDGTSFLSRIHETLTMVFSEVVVCGGSEVPPDGVLIRDDRRGEGPLSGLLSALRIAKGRSVFVTTVDTPMITPEAILSIAEPQVTGSLVRIACVAGEDQPLVGAYGSDTSSVIRVGFDAGQRSVRGVLGYMSEVERVEMDPDILFNVNTPTDYELLIERYGL